jgi:hypothetical protein
MISRHFEDWNWRQQQKMSYGATKVWRFCFFAAALTLIEGDPIVLALWRRECQKITVSLIISMI